VAFVILALGLSAILTGVAVAMRSDVRTQSTQIAFRLAQSRLEEAGVTTALIPGYREGQTAKNYRWQEKVTAVDLGARSPQSKDDKPDANKPDLTKSDTKTNAKPGQLADNKKLVPYWVEVTIQAADGTLARLSTLKLAPETRQ
jgi:general secretion pathway protein I